MFLLLDLIKNTYPLRTCNYDLSVDNIKKNKFRACLEFQIGKCKAPCVSKQTEDEYNQNIKEIRQIIKGDINFAIRDLKDKMNIAAEKYEFEQAEIFKNKIELLSNYQSKSTIVHPSITNTDVVNIISDEKNAYIHYFKIINGAIIHAQTIELKKKIDETDEELLLFAIIEFRNRFNSSSKEILVPFIPDITLPDCEYVIPKIGDKKQLLELCLKNAIAYKHEKETHDKKIKLIPKNIKFLKYLKFFKIVIILST
jgi:excinuclease ABC subunit C